MVGILNHFSVLHFVFLLSVSINLSHYCCRVVVSTIGISPSSVLLWNKKKLDGNYMIIGGYMQILFTNDYQVRNQYYRWRDIMSRFFQLVSDRFLRDISEWYYSDPTCQVNKTNSNPFFSFYSYFQSTSTGIQ